ncbi:MAG: hypothetical protein JHC98_01055 [Thermoleophilaceae bacterium]|nr:hypothetical protein [Thermoleophilaceae bacterium]
MYAPETDSPQADPQRHLVDLQYEEVSNARTAVLNRELVRMRGEGWNVQLVGDHLVASRREHGHSQMERMLIAVGGFLALAYAATIFMAGMVESLPGSKAVFLAGAAVVGGLIAFFTRGQAARDRRVSVSVDGQGRPFMADLATRDF